jgi:acetyl-CoA acyltransferase
MADCIIAGGAEICLSFQWEVTNQFQKVIIAKSHPDYYWGMGYTAEEVAKQYKITREEQDQFAFESHQKALKANLKENLQTNRSNSCRI